jgi:hypothetical protein
MPHLAPYYIVALLLTACSTFAIYSQRKVVRLGDRGWEDILSRIHKIDTLGLTTVALDYLNPPQHQTAIQPRELWKLVGAYDGLRRMRANADLLLALAAHASRWNYEEATVVSERMRRDAIRLRRAVLRIEVGFLPFAGASPVLYPNSVSDSRSGSRVLPHAPAPIGSLRLQSFRPPARSGRCRLATLSSKRGRSFQNARSGSVGEERFSAACFRTVRRFAE